VTHDELVIRIIKLSENNDENWKFYPSLRAVVELHKPDSLNYCVECEHDFISEPYPCPTIQAIEKELN